MNFSFTTAPDREGLSLAIAAIALVTVTVSTSFNSEVLGLREWEQPFRLTFRLATIAAGCWLLVFTSAVHDLWLVKSMRPAAAFVLLVVLSAVWSPVPGRTLVEGATFAFGFLIVASLTLWYGWERVARVVVVVTAILLLASAVLQLLNGPEVGDQRWVGVNGAPTGLAQVAVVGSALALCLWLSGDRSPALMAFVAGSAAIVVMSQSRIPLSVLGALVLYVLVMSVPRSMRMTRSIAVGAAALSILVLLRGPASKLALRDDIEAADLGEVSGRAEIWDVTLDLIAERPIIGHGFASGEHIYAEQVVDGRIAWFPSHTHQFVLEVLFSFGLVGLVLAAASAWSIFRARHIVETFVPRILLLTLVGLGLTEPVFHRATIYAVLLGIAVAAGRTKAAKDSALVEHAQPALDRTR